MAKTTNPPVYWAGSTRMPLSGKFLHEKISIELNDAVSSSRESFRGVSQKHLEIQLAVSKWLIEALYQGFCCLPRLPVALPLMRGDYSPPAIYNLPYGYEMVRRVLRTADRLGFIKVNKGKYNRSGKGFVTRLYPSGALLSHFRRMGNVWQRISPPSKDQGIFVNEGRGKVGRRLAKITDHPDVARMQRNLYEINLFLSKQCIYINLPDSAFNQPAGKFVKPAGSGLGVPNGSRNSLPTINFQGVFLSRIFTKDSFKVGHRLEGGRFYHGWWQNVRKELRPNILINDHVTAECDYSGMALSCLYAMEGIDIGQEDPYEIGLNFSGKNDPRRDVVKQYVVAVINDQSGKYQLSKTQLNLLGLTHKQLSGMVRKRHSAISQHFGTGVGLYLQFIDSCVAERVMLRFMRKKEVCLPIHDSFIVRAGLLRELENVMKDEYSRKLKKDISVKYSLAYTGLGIGEPRNNLLSEKAQLTEVEFRRAFDAHLKDYSIAIGYHRSWERQVFSAKQLAERKRPWD